MKWKKLPGYRKWIGYLDGKHVASIVEKGDGYRTWVDRGIGFQEVHMSVVPKDLKDCKRLVEMAHAVPVEAQ